MPALGLSNKAIFEEEAGKGKNLYNEGELQPASNSQYQEVYFSPLTLTRRSDFHIPPLRKPCLYV